MYQIYLWQCMGKKMQSTRKASTEGNCPGWRSYFIDLFSEILFESTHPALPAPTIIWE